MNSAAKEDFLFLADVTFLERGVLYTVTRYRKGEGVHCYADLTNWTMQSISGTPYPSPFFN